MANGGWYGTEEEWVRIEAPLKLLDPELERFARKHGLIMTKNHKDWPERSLVWGDKVRCLLQVFLVDEAALTFNLWLCASEDRAEGRYWKTESLLRGMHAHDMTGSLFELLEAGKAKLDEWSAHPDRLQFATKLG